MVSRSQNQQESTLLHSSGASNSSGSTTAVAVPPSEGNSCPSGKQQQSPLLRRGRMKLPNLFRSSKKSSTDGTTVAAPTTTVATNVTTNDKNWHTIDGGNDNATISSVIVTMDTTTTTTMEEKHRDVNNSIVWMESLYHNEMPTIVTNDDETGGTTTISNSNKNNDTKNEGNNVNIIGGSTNDTTLQDDRNEIMNEQQQQQPPTTNGSVYFCNAAPMGVPFFDRMCHIGRTGSDDSDLCIAAGIESDHNSHIQNKFHHNTLPDDPSIQESFECFFLAQQESILKEQQQQQQQKQKDTTNQQQQPSSSLSSRQNVVETVYNAKSSNNNNQVKDPVVENNNHHGMNRIQTPPSMIHQSLLKNRSISRLPIQFQRDVTSRSPRSSSLQHKQHSLPVENMFQHRIPPPPPPTEDENHLNDDKSSKLRNNSSVPTSTIYPESPSTSATHTTTSFTASTCICCQRQLPLLEPEFWPQRPLLLRPTPNSGTRIRGIRFVSSSKEYLWRPNDDPTKGSEDSKLTWPQALRNHWAKDTDTNNLPPPTPTSNNKNTTMCSQCMILPINNGKELPGESLVSDFESDWFIGTILVRLKDCHGTTIPNIREQTNGGYFHNLHRRYQVVIRGQFKHSVPWTECITGFQLERPCGKLPPKWIVNGALNVVRFFAPQLQTSITGPRPYSLTPLGSTPQSLIVHAMDTATDDITMEEEMLLTDRMKCDITMEVPQEEPRIDTNTLLGHATNAASSMQRARYRKKHFDKLYSDARHHQHHHQHHHINTSSSRSLPSSLERTTTTSSLNTDPSKIYTFEFLQHLLSFDDFTIELGSIVGSIHLQTILHGQPLQIMSSYQNPIPLSSSLSSCTGAQNTTKNTKQHDMNNQVQPHPMLQNRFWCFDIWHEMLYADAKAYDETQQQQNMGASLPSPELQLPHNEEENIFCQLSP